MTAPSCPILSFGDIIDLMEVDGDILRTSKLHKRLMNKAVHYLGRYQASRQRLRRVLQQFAKRKLQSDESNEPQKGASYQGDDIARAIEDIIHLCMHYGYVDDTALAQAKARQSVITGQSAYQLSGKLRQLGIDEATTKGAVHSREGHHQNAELAAGIRAMRKKRLGAFHPDYQALAREDKQKQFAKLARLGFSMDLIRQIFQIETREDAEEMLYEAEAKPDFETSPKLW